MYCSYSFTTSVLHGGEWSASGLGGEWSASGPGCALPPEIGHPVPIVQGARWAPEPVWTQTLEAKSLVSVADRTSIARSSSS
jgi:hypothetical protein